MTPFQIWRAWPSEEGLHQAALRRHLTNDLQRVGSGGETGEIRLPAFRKSQKKQVLHSVPVTPVKPAVKTEPQVQNIFVMQPFYSKKSNYILAVYRQLNTIYNR